MLSFDFWTFFLKISAFNKHANMYTYLGTSFKVQNNIGASKHFVFELLTKI